MNKLNKANERWANTYLDKTMTVDGVEQTHRQFIQQLVDTGFSVHRLVTTPPMGSNRTSYDREQIGYVINVPDGIIPEMYEAFKDVIAYRLTKTEYDYFLSLKKFL